MTDLPQRHDYVLHRLVALRDSYALSALIAAGDPARTRSLSDDYLRDATLVMSAAYGRSCADQVRANRPSVHPAAAARAQDSPVRAAGRRLVRALADAARRNAEEWHHQTSGLAGRW